MSGSDCPTNTTDLVTGVTGSEVTYCFVVTNTGDVTLDPVTVNDPDLGITQANMTVVAAGSTGTLPALAPGEKVTLAYEGTITVDLTNTATATGTPPTGDDVTADDTADVDLIAPAITIDKTVYAGHSPIISGNDCPTNTTDLVTGVTGSEVTYCFVVTNTGDVTLDPVTVNDPDLGITQANMTVVAAGSTGTLPALAPGEKVTLAYEGTITVDLTNTATATGTPPTGDDVTADDTADVDLIAPAITIDKTVYAGHSTPTVGSDCPTNTTDLVTGVTGSEVTYCFVVTNTGDVTLDPVTVNDPDLGITQANMTVVAAGSTGTLPALAPGEKVTLAYEGTITVDLTNTATATGTPPTGDDVTADDTADVDLIAPAITIDKTVYAGHSPIISGNDCPTNTTDLVTGVTGSEVTYCFVVTNTGDVTLDPVTVNDPDLGITQANMTVVAAGSTGTLPALAPGEKVTLAYEGTITVDLTNTATATGTPPTGDDVTADDTADVDLIAPAITIDKTVYAGHSTPDGDSCPGTDLVQGVDGDAVTYCFVVTNTGDVTLNPVTVADPDLGITQADMTVVAAGSTGTLPSLAPGEVITLAYEDSITESLVNTATATGTPPVGDAAHRRR